MTTGVYAIQHKESRKRYVGQSLDVERRLKRHVSQLKAGSHKNKKMQNAWSKHGHDSFEFIILSICDVDALDEIEQQCIDAVPSELRYNIALFVESPNRGLSPSDETREKLSKAGRGRILTEEEKDKVRASRDGDRKPVYARNLANGEIITFTGLYEAKRAGFTASSIRKCLRGELVSHKGMLWSHKGSVPLRVKANNRVLTCDMAECSICKAMKPWSAFPLKKDKPHSYCRVCFADYRQRRATGSR